MFTPTAFASILPEILLLVLGILILVFEPFWKEEQRRNAGWLTAGGLLVTIIVSLLFGRPGEPVSTFGGMIRFDWLGFFLKMLFLFAGAATALLLMDHERAGRRGESYLLLLASLLGMDLMAVSSDLVMLYLSIETASIPLYILAGFLLNAHASLLPRHRGAAPIAHAILAGDAETGISVMRVEREMDAGAVALVRRTPIGPDETTGALEERLAQLAADAIEEAVARQAAGGLTWREQDPSQATLAPKLTADDARLDWRGPAAALARKVRAMAPRPGAWTTWEGERLRILHARAVAAPGADP
ncbi:MAG: hypothetical protein DPW18_20280, partial [Chloroflexi bacterium]|nr:hypothetical protein [Chloroflexota bacterium]